MTSPRILNVLARMRPCRIFRLSASLASILFLCAFSASARAAELPLGQLIENVPCVHDASHSYALYLPSTYDPSNPAPVLYCLDPRGRGAHAAGRFVEGAEKFGYIVVGSNNSRNGPWDANKAAIETLLRDTHERFAINRARIYTAGLSGGARVATRLGLAGLCAGTIACSGGFPIPETPPAPGFAVFGTTGIDDCNYDEMRRIDDDLDKSGAPHRIALFDGGHEWLPSRLGAQAIEWLEIQAMRAGLRQRDDALIDAAFQARVAAIPSTAPEAWLEIKSLAADFKTLRDTAELEKRAATLGQSRELRDWRKQEARAERDTQFMVGEIVQSAATGDSAVMRRTIENWRKQAAATEDSSRRRVMRRVIQGAAIQLEQTARAAYSAGGYETAVWHFEAISMLQPERAGIHFDIARASAMNNDEKSALAALQQAAAAGFKDHARVEKEEALESIRGEPAYRDVVALMKTNAATAAPR